MRETRLARGDQDGGGGGRRDRDERREELQPTRIDNDSCHESGGKRDPRGATEREVQRREEEHEKRGACRTRADCPRARGEAEGEERTDCREEPEAVPVADGLCEAVDAAAVEDSDSIGHEASREAERSDERDCREDASKHVVTETRSRDQQNGEAGSRVDKRALRLEDALRRRSRPGDRDREPSREGR